MQRLLSTVCVSLLFFLLAPSIASAVTENYRSIGTNAGVLYSVGKASIAAGSSVVTFGAETSLPDHVGIGEALNVGNETFFILS
jgi:hypothetical protein